MGRFFSGGGNSYWLLVTRYSCFLHRGRWALCVSRCDDHPAGLSPTKIIIFAGPDMPAPLRRGELIPRRYKPSSPPLEGCPQGGVVRECETRVLSPHWHRGRHFWRLLVTGNSLLVTCYSCLPPPVVQSTTPPAQLPPTQTLFARGPGAVGIIRCLIPIVIPGLDHGAQVIKIPRNARTNL